MQSGSILGALAIGVALTAAATPARAAEPAAAAPTLADVFDRAWQWSSAWSAELPAASAWLSRTLPTIDLLIDPSSWSTRAVVALRDAAATVATDVFALLPMPTTPDLTILTASPVPGVESSGFGWRRDPIHHHDKFHKGTDFRADRGTPVYAAGAGIVAFTGRQTGYGNVIYVDHGGGVITRYAHLSRIGVTAGASVLAAHLIGQVGATGRATGPHLHFEIRLDGRAVDPEVAMRVAELQRTDPARARWTAWLLSPAAQADRVDRHDPPRHLDRDRANVRPSRPERRHAPTRDRSRS